MSNFEDNYVQEAREHVYGTAVSVFGEDDVENVQITMKAFEDFAREYLA